MKVRQLTLALLLPTAEGDGDFDFNAHGHVRPGIGRRIEVSCGILRCA